MTYRILLMVAILLLNGLFAAREVFAQRAEAAAHAC